MKGHLMGIKFLIRSNSPSLLGIRKIGLSKFWAALLAEIQGNTMQKRQAGVRATAEKRECSGQCVRPWAQLAVAQDLIATM